MFSCLIPDLHESLMMPRSLFEGFMKTVEGTTPKSRCFQGKATKSVLNVALVMGE